MRKINQFAICLWMFMMLVWAFAGLFLFTKYDLITRCLLVAVGVIVNIFLISKIELK